MSGYAKVIDEVINDAVTPVLKTAGFRKSGHTFRRTGEGWIKVVNVQGSAWNAGEDARFTINLGVYYAALAPLLDERAPTSGKSGPTENSCHVRERIGRLLPAGEDYWWSIQTNASGVELAKVKQDVHDALVNFGLPWLDSREKLAVAREDFLRLGSEFHAAAASIVLGECEAATLHLQRAIAGFPARSNRFLAWGSEHGLPVNQDISQRAR